MKLKEFKYNDKLRKLIVFENTDTYITGIDVSCIEKTLNDKGEVLPDELQEATRVQKLAENFVADSNGLLSDSDFALIKPYMKYFKRFSKSKIDSSKEESVDTKTEKR